MSQFMSYGKCQGSVRSIPEHRKINSDHSRNCTGLCIIVTRDHTNGGAFQQWRPFGTCCGNQLAQEDLASCCEFLVPGRPYFLSLFGIGFSQRSNIHKRSCLRHSRYRCGRCTCANGLQHTSAINFRQVVLGLTQGIGRFHQQCRLAIGICFETQFVGFLAHLTGTNVLCQGHAESWVTSFFSVPGNVATCTFLKRHISKHFGVFFGPVAHDTASHSIGFIFPPTAGFACIVR